MKGAYPYYKYCPTPYIQGVGIGELWAGSRSVTETYENASAYRYGRCEAASIRKTSKDVFMVFFYLREK